MFEVNGARNRQRTPAHLLVAISIIVASMLLPARPVAAHDPGSSSVQVQVDAEEVRIELWLPLDVLADASGLALRNEQSITQFRSDTLGYITNGVDIHSATGDVWTEAIGEPIVLAQGDGETLRVSMTFTPPTGVVEDFDLFYSVIVGNDKDHEAIVGVIDDARSVLGGATISGTDQVVTVTTDGNVQASSFQASNLADLEREATSADRIVFFVALIILIGALASLVGGVSWLALKR